MSRSAWIEDRAGRGGMRWRVIVDPPDPTVDPPISALMSLFCCIRGSFWAWESWWVAAESE